MPSPVKLVCFDLDCTIVNGRLGWSLATAGVKRGEADRDALEFHLQNVGGIKNRLALQKTLKDLLKNGTQVAITSYCKNPEAIPFVLEKVGLTKEEIAQVKIFCFRPEKEIRDTHGKNDHLALALKECGDLKPSEVVLVDDNVNNFELAQKEGYQVVWVQGSEGSVDYLNELRELTGLSTAQAAALSTFASQTQPTPAKSWATKIIDWLYRHHTPALPR